MRKPNLLPSLSYSRLALLGFAVVLTVLALLTIPAQPVSAQAGCNGYIYCTTWGYAEGCCLSGGAYHSRQKRTCTDGIGHYCTQYKCLTGPCAF
jgi:hypothetical protein